MTEQQPVRSGAHPEIDQLEQLLKSVNGALHRPDVSSNASPRQTSYGPSSSHYLPDFEAYAPAQTQAKAPIADTQPLPPTPQQYHSTAGDEDISYQQQQTEAPRDLHETLFGPPTDTAPRQFENPSRKRVEAPRRKSRVLMYALSTAALFCTYGAAEEVFELEQRTPKDVAIAAVSGFVTKIPYTAFDIIDHFYQPDVENLRGNIKEETPETTAAVTPTEAPTSSALTPSPSVTPEATQAPTPTQTPTPTQSPTETTKPNDPRAQKENAIAGLSANYLPPMTAEEVKQLESCHSVEEGILLTFNDTGSYETLTQIVKILDEKKVSAAFFPTTGSGLFETQSVIDWLRARGFYVGTYAKNQEDLVSTTVDPNDPVSVENNINSIVEKITSSGKANLYRPPFEGMYTDPDDGNVYFDPYVREAMIRANVQGCLSTIQTHDLVTTTTAADIAETVRKNLKPDSVISAHMHDESKIVEALPTIIDEARAKGYDFIKNPGKPTLPDFTVMPIGS